jgi:hypothetical protein
MTEVQTLKHPVFTKLGMNDVPLKAILKPPCSINYKNTTDAGTRDVADIIIAMNFEQHTTAYLPAQWGSIWRDWPMLGYVSEIPLRI